MAHPENIHYRKHALFAGYIAVLIVSVMILSKAAAYSLSGSTSILSSLMDSLLDCFISLTAIASIYYASRPADENHRWGHGKMEAVSALFQAAVITAGGTFVIFESFSRVMNPQKIEHHILGIGVMALSIVLSLILVVIQRYTLHKAQSLAVEADSTHYSSDIFVNLGVMGVLFAGYNGAPAWLDPLFAVMVSAFLGHAAYKIGAKAVNMLMDRELPDEDRQRIINVIEAHGQVIGWHDLRTHRHGPNIILSFDIEVEGTLLLTAAHDIAKDLEAGILEYYPNAEIMIHIDPHGYTDDARHRVKGIHH